MNAEEHGTWLGLYYELVKKHECYYHGDASGFEQCKADAARGVEHAQKTLALYLARRMTK